MHLEADWLKQPESRRIIDLLLDGGHEAFFVGGCVRNAILDELTTDIDISTSAVPDDVVALGRQAGIKTLPTGIDHGTVTMIVNEQAFEVTTFRKDVETDGRHAKVQFSKDIHDDAVRRDFTMNAIYCDINGEVVDPLEGLPDLLARRVKFILDGNERVKEDYLRILRFFRFFAWYGDQSEGLDPESLAACAGNLKGLATLAKERIGAEVRKLLSAPEPQMAVAAMAQCGVLQRVLEDADVTGFAPLIHLEKSLNIEPDWRRRLVALGLQDWTHDLRLSRKDARFIAEVRSLVNSNVSDAEGAYRHGADAAISAYLVRIASLQNSGSTQKVDQIRDAARAVFPIKAQDLPATISGKALGDTLRELEDKWIASRFTLTKQGLLK